MLPVPYDSFQIHVPLTIYLLDLEPVHNNIPSSKYFLIHTDALSTIFILLLAEHAPIAAMVIYEYVLLCPVS